MADLLQITDPPALAAPRLSLLATVPVINVAETDIRFGIKFTPEPSGGEGGPFDISCGATPNVGGDESTVKHHEEYGAFGVFEPESCSTFGYAAVDVASRADRALVLDESKQVEHELWTGQNAQAANLLTNRWLARNVAGPEDGGTFPPAVTQLNGGVTTQAVRALADLEWAIAQGRSGGRCIIHCNRITATYWIHEYLLYRSGNVLLTIASDTLVVPGEGYTGSAPDGTAMNANHNSAWAYATGPIRAFRAPAPTVEPAFPDLTTRNLRTAIARSVYALEIDPSVYVGIQVTHTPS